MIVSRYSTLIDQLQRIVDRNVHVRRIREPEAYEPTERMLTTAENSRQDVYRDAARLLRIRDRLFDGDEDELHRLLDETAITPDDENTLFELFVLFRFVSTLETMQGSQPQFSTIATDKQEIARFAGPPEVVLYHDNSVVMMADWSGHYRVHKVSYNRSQAVSSPATN